MWKKNFTGEHIIDNFEATLQTVHSRWNPQQGED
jgi:hypothetical protein